MERHDGILFVYALTLQNENTGNEKMAIAAAPVNTATKLQALATTLAFKHQDRLKKTLFYLSTVV